MLAPRHGPVGLGAGPWSSRSIETAVDVSIDLDVDAVAPREVTGVRIEVVDRTLVDPCFIDADPSQFDTVLFDMAADARDATDGAGRLTITVARMPGIPAPRTRMPDAGAFVAITITDTGGGITAGRIGRTSVPSFTTRDVGPGTGPGLVRVFGVAPGPAATCRPEAMSTGTRG